MPEFVLPDHVNPNGADRKANDRWVGALRSEGANEDLSGSSLSPKAQPTQRIITGSRGPSPRAAAASPRSAASPHSKPVPHFMQPIHRFKKRKCSAEALLRLRCKLMGVATDSDDFFDAQAWPNYFEGQATVSFDTFFDTVNRALSEAGTPLELDEPSVLVSVLGLTTGAPVDTGDFMAFLLNEDENEDDDLPPPPDSEEDDAEYQLGGVPLVDDFETRRRARAFTSKPCDTPEVEELTIAEKMRIRNKIMASAYTFEGINVEAEFRRMDRNRSGAISGEELAYALLRRGVNVPFPKLKLFLDAMDADANGNITLNEFCRFLGVQPRPPKQTNGRRRRRRRRRRSNDDDDDDDDDARPGGRDEFGDDESSTPPPSSSEDDSDDDDAGPSVGDLWINTLRSPKNGSNSATKRKPKSLLQKYVRSPRNERAKYARRGKKQQQQSGGLSEELVRLICNKLTAAAYCYRGGADIAAHFKRIDKDHDGVLSYEEFIHAVKRLCPLSDSEAMALLQMVDENGDGDVAYGEFANLLRPVKKKKQQGGGGSSGSRSVSEKRSPHGMRPADGEEDDKQFLERLSSPKSTLSSMKKEREPKVGEPAYDSRQFYQAMRQTQMRKAIGRSAQQKAKQNQRGQSASKAARSSEEKPERTKHSAQQKRDASSGNVHPRSVSAASSARKTRRRAAGMSSTDQRIQAFLMGQLSSNK